MRRSLVILFTAAFLLLAAPVRADFTAGVDALNQGDHVAAARIFQDAAEAGDARAQYNLALLYSYGQGVAQSDAEAVRWWRQAAARVLLQTRLANGRQIA